MLSDGKQASKEIGDKVKCADEQVQVVIDGAQGLSSRLLNPSKVNTFRQQASESSGTGNKIDHPTSCQRYA